MSSTQFLSMKKLKGIGILRKAAAHNLREIKAEFNCSKIDISKIVLNEVLYGPTTASEVDALAKRLMEQAGATFKRKDAVRGLEIIFSLPPQTNIDIRSYFVQSIQWCKSYFGVPVLSAVWHNDESAPHCHILLLPLKGNRMNGSALMGSRSTLRSLQLDFFEKVSSQYGFSSPTPEKLLTAQEKKLAALRVFSAIQKDPCLLNLNSVKEEILKCFETKIHQLLKALSLESRQLSQQLARKKFVTIMTKQCKPTSARPKGRNFHEPYRQ